jgi:hypothetical protein
MQPVIQAQLDAFEARQAQQAADARRRLQDEMLRRGVLDSTIYTSRYGDLEAELARQQKEFQAELLRQQAQAYANDVQNALAAAMGFGENQFQHQLQTAMLNRMYDQDWLQLLFNLLGGYAQ